MNTIQSLVDFVKNNRESLSQSVKMFNEDPQLLRNQLCELGIELTPDELNSYLTLLKDLLSIP